MATKQTFLARRLDGKTEHVDRASIVEVIVDRQFLDRDPIRPRLSRWRWALGGKLLRLADGRAFMEESGFVRAPDTPTAFELSPERLAELEARLAQAARDEKEVEAAGRKEWRGISGPR